MSTGVDESVSDKSEREHPDDTDVKGTDLGKTEREKPDDNDVNESDSGEKDEDEDHHSTLVPWNEFILSIHVLSGEVCKYQSYEKLA